MLKRASCVVLGLSVALMGGAAWAQYEKGPDGQEYNHQQTWGQSVETQWQDPSQADKAKMDLDQAEAEKQRELEIQKQKEAELEKQKWSQPAPAPAYNAPAYTPPAYNNSGQAPPTFMQVLPGVVQQLMQPQQAPVQQAPVQQAPTNVYQNPTVNPQAIQRGEPITLENRLRWTETRLGQLEETLAEVSRRCQNNCCAKVYSAPYNATTDQPRAVQPITRPNERWRLDDIVLKGINNIQITSRSTVILMGSAVFRANGVIAGRQTLSRGRTEWVEPSVYTNFGLEVSLSRDTQSQQGVTQVSKGVTPLAIGYRQPMNMSNNALPVQVFHSVRSVEPGNYFVSMKPVTTDLADPDFVTVARNLTPLELTVIVLPEQQP